LQSAIVLQLAWLQQPCPPPAEAITALHQNFHSSLSEQIILTFGISGFLRTKQYRQAKNFVSIIKITIMHMTRCSKQKADN
jgi:hypothetical protein